MLSMDIENFKIVEIIRCCANVLRWYAAYCTTPRNNITLKLLCYDIESEVIMTIKEVSEKYNISPIRFVIMKR